jgi:hypothetical protein
LPDFGPAAPNSRKKFPRIGLEEAGTVKEAIIEERNQQ